MERLLIILAVLACIVAGFSVVAMSLRERREPLRLDSEIDVDDEELLLGSVGAPESPIDREAPVLDPGAPGLDRAEARARLAGPSPEDGR